MMRSFLMLFVLASTYVVPAYSATLEETLPQIHALVRELPDTYEFYQPLRMIDSLILASEELKNQDLFDHTETKFLVQLVNLTLKTLHPKVPDPTPAAEPKRRFFGLLPAKKSRPIALALVENPYGTFQNFPEQQIIALQTAIQNIPSVDSPIREKLFLDVTKWRLRTELNQLVYGTTEMPTAPSWKAAITQVMNELKLSGVLFDGSEQSAKVKDSDYINTEIRHDLSESRDVHGSLQQFATELHVGPEMRFVRKMVRRLAEHQNDRHFIRLQMSLLHDQFLVPHLPGMARAGSSGGDSLTETDVSQGPTAKINLSAAFTNYAQSLLSEPFSYSEENYFVIALKKELKEKLDQSRDITYVRTEYAKLHRQLTEIESLIQDSDLAEWLRQVSSIYKESVQSVYQNVIMGVVNKTKLQTTLIPAPLSPATPQGRLAKPRNTRSPLTVSVTASGRSTLVGSTMSTPSTPRTPQTSSLR